MQQVFRFFLTISLMAVFLTVAPQAGAGEAPIDMQIILDVSGSMNGLIGDKKKIDIAKRALATALDEISTKTFVSFRAYGHNIPRTDKAKSCLDSEVLVPFAPLDKFQIISKSTPLTPRGYTPLAYSIKLAGNDLRTRKDAEHLIILVSDGEETCGGDPVAEAKSLIQEGIKVKIHTVGFDVGDLARAQLEAIAKASGGRFYLATDAISLTESLKEISKETIPKKEAITELTGEIKVKGGDNYETAVAYNPAHYGKVVSFVHHIKAGAPEAFYVVLGPGKGIKIEAYTGENGIKILPDGSVQETGDYPEFHVGIKDSTRREIGSLSVHGKNKSGFYVIPELASGRSPAEYKFYLLVGERLKMHRNSRMKIDFLEQFDAGSGTDTPNKIRGAGKLIDIKAGVEYQGWTSKNDKHDFYRLSAVPAGSTLSFRVDPTADNSRFILDLFNEDRESLVSFSPKSVGAPTKGQYQVKEGIPLILKVSGMYADEGGKYTLSAKIINQPGP